MTIAGSTTTYQEPIATGTNREDLGNVVWDVSPTDTPGLTAMGKNQATATSHDFITDKLEDAAANAVLEGDDANPQRAGSRVRLSNYTQILSKTAKVSGTQERVLKGGGIKSELAYQVARRIREMKRDMEYAIYGMSNAKVGGAEGTAREMGSFDTYVVDGWSGGATSTPPTGNGVDTGTKGTARPLEDAWRPALEGLFNRSGGNENVLAIMGANQRAAFSDLPGTSTRYVTTDDRRLEASIDVYNGDFHTVTAAPDRFCRTDAVYVQDNEFVKCSELRPMFTKPLPEGGDYSAKQVIWEATLEVSNPDAHLVIDSLTPWTPQP